MVTGVRLIGQPPVARPPEGIHVSYKLTMGVNPLEVKEQEYVLMKREVQFDRDAALRILAVIHGLPVSTVDEIRLIGHHVEWLTAVPAQRFFPKDLPPVDYPAQLANEGLGLLLTELRKYACGVAEDTVHVHGQFNVKGASTGMVVQPVHG